MTCRKRWLLLLLVTLLPVNLYSPPGKAAPVENRGGSAGRGVDADGAAAAVRRATGGKVLRVEPGNRDGNPGYRVKVLTEDGRVRVLNVDADTGRLSD